MEYRKTKLAIIILPVMVLSILLLAGCGKNNPASPNNNNPPPDGTPENLVVISNFSYSPATITVAAGQTVTWRNDDNVGHTVTSDSGSELGSPVLTQGQTYQHTFSAAGTYAYHCTIHSNMHGSVTVQ